MSDPKGMQSTLGETKGDDDLVPGTASNATEELHPSHEERSLNIGESGQFAPGGRYNELGATAPRRLDLDEQVDSALGEKEGGG